MKIYFSGIGGVGIGPLAQIAHYAGYEVTGSDRHDSLLTENLKNLGIDFEVGAQDGSFLMKSNNNKPIDWFVYTAALPYEHPELTEARKLGLKIAKRDELLSKIIKDKGLKLIALAGTHGKTGTTALTVWLFKELGLPASYSIGSTIGFGTSGFYDKNSSYFIYECDEFDRNFLHFNPYLSIITSLDYDHPDTYPTESDYLNAFKDFVRNSEIVVAWDDQPEIVYEGANNVTLLSSKGLAGENRISPDITLPGMHNRKNASLVLNGLTKLGIINDQNYGQAINAINSFPGADRRFERIAPNLYTDYGHHPIEIEATLNMAQELASKENRDIVLVYQPHQNIRQVEVQDEYTDDVFENSDKIIWLPTYLSRENPDLEILTPDFLTRKIDGDKVKFTDLNEDLVAEIAKLKDKNYLVLAMSAGTLDGWVRDNFAN